MVMASLLLPSNHAFLFSSSSPSFSISKRFPFLSLMIHQRRQHLGLFKERAALGFSILMEEKKGLGVSLLLLQKNSCFGSVRRRCYNKGWESEGDLALEEKILEFMNNSENPNKFPTKKDLINAGRVDLVEAIEKTRDWLSSGWDLDEDKDIVQKNEFEDLSSGLEERDFDSEFLHSDDRIFQERFYNGGELDSLEGIDVGTASGSSCSPPSFSGREMEMESGEKNTAGIDGILRGLEKERNLAFGFGSRGKESDKENDCRIGSSMFSSNKRGTATSLRPTTNDSDNVSKVMNFGKGSFSDVDDMGNSLKPDMWRAWSTQRQGLSQSEFEAAEIETDVATDNTVLAKVANETRNEWTQTDQNWFRSRIQHLELELASTLNSLKSAAEINVLSWKGSESPSEELHELSDAWEFQETEIMNARDKLRSIRAKLAILEGKIALTTIEAQKTLEMKQKRINNARMALNTLRTTCIVWPNSASVVLVCGSFDGWSNQRSMEKSSAGFFSLCLMLYPGRYEFKFIVDGEWKVDPLRPIVRNNGYENNVLIIP